MLSERVEGYGGEEYKHLKVHHSKTQHRFENRNFGEIKMFASIDLHTLIDLSMTALLRLLDYKSLLAEKLTRTFEALVSFYPLNPVLFLIMQQICPKAKRSI